MGTTPAAPKESASTRLARFFRQSAQKTVDLLWFVIRSIRSIFAIVHQRTLGHPLAKTLASRLVGWGFIGTGIAVAKWDEYGSALGLFFVGSFVLLLQAYHWQGWENYKKLSNFLRVLFMIGTVFMIAAAYPITNAKRGDKPWSDALHRLTFVPTVRCPRCFIPTPDNWAAKQHFDARVSMSQRHGDVHEPEIKFAPAGFVSFVGQVINDWAPMLQENQTQEPLYDVQLQVLQAVLQSATDPGPWTSEWHKQIDIGTARALLTKGLDERFYVGKHHYVRFDISMLTRFISYREIIVMTKENEKQYKAKLSFYKGGEGKPMYERTMTVGIVTEPHVKPKETGEPVEVPPQPTAPPLFADIRIASQAPDVSTNPTFPYALKAIIQTNLEIKPVAFEFECDGDIGEGDVWEGSGPQRYTMRYVGVAPHNKHIYVAAWKDPPFTPDQPLTAMIYSKQPLKMIAIRRIKYEWPF